MSYTEYTAANFGPSKTGLSTVGYRLYNSSGSPLAARITAGINERAPGYYAASVVFPDGFIGELRWDTGEGSPLYASLFINPRDGENLDAKISSIASVTSGAGAYTVTVTVTDGANPVQNAWVRLTEGINSFADKTDINGVAVFALDAATYGIAITKPGYSFTPDEIVVTGAANFPKVIDVQPAPAADDIALCRVYGSFETIDNRPLANITIEFTLVAPDPIASERLIANRKVKVKTDALGQLVNRDDDPWIDLQRNDYLTPDTSFYRVNAPALNIDNAQVTLEQPSFDLVTLAVP